MTRYDVGVVSDRHGEYCKYEDVEETIDDLNHRIADLEAANNELMGEIGELNVIISALKDDLNSANLD